VYPISAEPPIPKIKTAQKIAICFLPVCFFVRVVLSGVGAFRVGVAAGDSVIAFFLGARFGFEVSSTVAEGARFLGARFGFASTSSSSVVRDMLQ
jgi:hypothetical protein